MNSNRSVIKFLLMGIGLTANFVDAATDYTPGKQHNYTHSSGDVPKDVYQYSVWVPKDYQPAKTYPVVFYLHGGGKGRKHPDNGKRNMVSATLLDNDRTTDAGYSRHQSGFHGYILVSPVKPIARWNARQFGRLLEHVKNKVSINENRVYVTGFSMGGQGTWHVACGNPGNYKIAAMMPLGAWGCREVRHGKTPETCRTLKTAVWVQHCPLDPVSKISEQLRLFDSHIECGGYGRFTMIPGKGHISRGANDGRFFNKRMSWMLAQDYQTPFNYMVEVNGGTIGEIKSGMRPFKGDDSRFGFFEPGTVIGLDAPATKNGQPFVKWACVRGVFSDAFSRSSTFTTEKSDAEICAIYGNKKTLLTIEGGFAEPAAPSPGDIVKVTVDENQKGKRYFYWKSGSPSLDVAIPYQRSFTFVMPSAGVTLAAEFYSPR